MKDLTKKQRHKIYIKALAIYNKEIKDNTFLGLCYSINLGRQYISNNTIANYSNYDPYKNMYMYPEIYKYKPNDINSTYNFWFSTTTPKGIAKRIEILTNAIKDTE